MKFKVKKVIIPIRLASLTGLILHSDTEQIYLIDYIFIHIHIYT